MKQLLYKKLQNLSFGYRFVYVDYGLRLFGQFFIFSCLVKTVPSTQFANYAYYLMVSGYIAVVINSSLDSLINKHFAENNGENYYTQALKLKILLYGIFSFIAIFILNIKIVEFYPYWALGLIGILLEHLDIKMRFFDNYHAVKYRILFAPMFFIIKFILAIQGIIIEILYVSIMEAFLCFLISLRFIGLHIFLGKELLFIRDNYKQIITTTLSGVLIFSFLQLDQFLVYKFLDKELYKFYAIVYKFYGMSNALLGIYTRYIIPKLYGEQITYRFALIRISVVNISLSIISYIVFYIYIHFWLPEYIADMTTFLILLLASFGLIFGQIRGIYFVKRNDLVPDLANAIIGILALVSCFYFLRPQTTIQVALCFMIGVIISGIMTTVLYKNGRNYIRLIFEGK